MMFLGWTNLDSLEVFVIPLLVQYCTQGKVISWEPGWFPDLDFGPAAI